MITILVVLGTNLVFDEELLKRLRFKENYTCSSPLKKNASRNIIFTTRTVAECHKHISCHQHKQFNNLIVHRKPIYKSISWKRL